MLIIIFSGMILLVAALCLQLSVVGCCGWVILPVDISDIPQTIGHYEFSKAADSFIEIGD